MRKRGKFALRVVYLLWHSGHNLEVNLMCLIMCYIIGITSQ